MSMIETLMSIVKVDGEVMLHDGRSGWVRAYAGMVFSAGAEITVKTGLSGRAEVISPRGERIVLPPHSMRTISGAFAADEVDTLRQIAISARDIVAVRSVVRQRVAPAV